MIKSEKGKIEISGNKNTLRREVLSIMRVFFNIMTMEYENREYIARRTLIDLANIACMEKERVEQFMKKLGEEEE